MKRREKRLFGLTWIALWFVAGSVAVLPVVFAQQPPPVPVPLEVPTCEQQLQDYSLNVSNWVQGMMRLETTTKVQAGKIADLTKARDEALEKLKKYEPPPAAVTPDAPKPAAQ